MCRSPVRTAMSGRSQAFDSLFHTCGLADDVTLACTVAGRDDCRILELPEELRWCMAHDDGGGLAPGVARPSVTVPEIARALSTVC